MAHYKRKKSRYQYRCAMCNQARTSRMNGELPNSERKNKSNADQQMRDLKDDKTIQNPEDS